MIDSFDDNDKQPISITLLKNSNSSTSRDSINLQCTKQNDEEKYIPHIVTNENTVTIRKSNYTPITQVKQLFVGNLPFRVRWQDLKDLFRRAGQVQRADVALNYDGRSKGHGTVLFETVEDAQTAINMLHNFKWFGRILEVREDRGYIEHHPSSLSVNKTVIDQHDQRYYYQTQRSNINNNKSTEKHYIQSNGKSDVKNVTTKQDPIQSGRQLFVGNLPYYCQWQDLKDLFRGAGNILRADVAQEPDGKKNLGYGIVLYATLEDAKRAIAMYDGYKYQGRQLRVRFDKYAPFTLNIHQDQYTQQQMYSSKKYTSDVKNNINYNYLPDKDVLDCLQQTYGKFNNENNNNIHHIADHFYPAPSGLFHLSTEKNINSNNNNSNNNLFDMDVFTDTNSTVFSSSFTTQSNYEQQQQQQLQGFLYQQESYTTNLNHQYSNKCPSNPSLISNYNPSKNLTTTAMGITSPPLYMYHENSPPPIESTLSFQLSPSSLDSIEKNTSSLSSSHFHHLYSTNSSHPLMAGAYDLYTFQHQHKNMMNENKIRDNDNGNNNISTNMNNHHHHEYNSIDQHLFDNDDKIHLLNVINTIGLNDDSAGLNNDFLLSSFIEKVNGGDEVDLNNDGITKDKFLKSEISTLWDQ